MKVLLVHNEHGRPSGEEVIVQCIKNLIEENGHQVIYYIRSSAEISEMPFGNFNAFISGIYSRESRKILKNLLVKHQPDVVHVHNLFPFISPSILPICRKLRFPVVMTVHNYRLVCPNGLHMRSGEICMKCASGHEYWCVLRNCERNLFKSIGYAFRNWFARKRRFFLDNVTIFVTLTQFQRQRLLAEGFPADRITVIPNMASSKDKEQNARYGSFVGFIGRISPEKGIQTFMDAASKCADISFKVAGSYDRMPHLLASPSSNFDFVGHLSHEKLDEFYKAVRMIVLPSICFEGFPMVLAEAMLYGKPVICSRIGGLPEIVEDGKTGLLFESADAEDLSVKIRYLWNRPDLCRKMGHEGRKKALREYSPKKYYKRLMEVYQKAIESLN